MNGRGDHLAWMHRHFAHRVVTGSELLAEVEAEAEEPGGWPVVSQSTAPRARRTTRTAHLVLLGYTSEFRGR